MGGKRPVSANQQSTGKLSNRPYSSDYDLVATVGISKQTTQRQPSTSSCSTGIRPLVTERSILFATLCAQDDIKNFPAEELLELGKCKIYFPRSLKTELSDRNKQLKPEECIS